MSRCSQGSIQTLQTISETSFPEQLQWLSSISTEHFLLIRNSMRRMMTSSHSLTSSPHSYLRTTRASTSLMHLRRSNFIVSHALFWMLCFLTEAHLISHLRSKITQIVLSSSLLQRISRRTLSTDLRLVLMTTSQSLIHFLS